MPEEWKLIPNWPGYEASNEGRIKSVARVIVRGKGIRQPIRERILKPSLDKWGRPFVVLTGQKVRRVHTLILEAFVGPCPPGMEACHWDDDPLNNRIDNLRWDTRSANRRDAVRNGRHRWANHTECNYGHKLTNDNIIWHGPDKRWRRCRTCTKDRRRVQELNTPTKEETDG